MTHSYLCPGPYFLEVLCARSALRISLWFKGTWSPMTSCGCCSCLCIRRLIFLRARAFGRSHGFRIHSCTLHFNLLTQPHVIRRPISRRVIACGLLHGFSIRPFPLHFEPLDAFRRAFTDRSQRGPVHADLRIKIRSTTNPRHTLLDTILFASADRSPRGPVHADMRIKPDVICPGWQIWWLTYPARAIPWAPTQFLRFQRIPERWINFFSFQTISWALNQFS